MISKEETLQCLKKMGMNVADDQSIVTVLLPKEVAFEVGLKDVRQKLKDLGYESSFCVKQSKDSVVQSVTDSYMAVDSEDRFSLDDDGQFTLGLEF